MIYTTPDYYEEFACLADRCEDTCCAGWQIVLDQESQDAYNKVEGEFGERLRASIDWEEGVFRQSEERRCAFLNEENLCDMYKALGPDSLCHTCRTYPRHIEEFENIREISLSVSCPEAARILLNKKEPVTFPEREDDMQEEDEEFDPFLFSVLEDARDVMCGVLQDRTLDMAVRSSFVWQLAEQMQEYIDEGMLFSCNDLLEEYEREECRRRIEEQAEEWRNDWNSRFEFSREMYGKLYELELLEESWVWLLGETEEILYDGGAVEYRALHETFAEWMDKNLPNWKIIQEQLAVYFIHTYFCGAVYDGMPAAKMRMSLVSTFLIWEILAARWQKNEGMLDMEDIIFVTYRYSRELEHSDYNLETLEDTI